VLNPRTGCLSEKHANSALHWSRCFEWPWALLNGELMPECTCLDAGGSHAIFQYALARRAGATINVDLEPNLRAVEDMKTTLNLPNLSTEQGDLTKLRFHDGFFERVFCISVVEHMVNWMQAITELLRVTAPGGILILTLDVNMHYEVGQEFAITMADVNQLLAPYGVFPEPTEWPILNRMPDGSKLSCLCLKFKKDKV